MNLVSCISLTAVALTLFHISVGDANERFIFFMTNPGEGFNLRRDVFMRIAVMVKKLNDLRNYKYTIVLPQWSRLYHWQSRHLGDQNQIAWRNFFDLESMNRFVPVIDFDEFKEVRGKVMIDKAYILQHFSEGWENGKFVEKIELRDCIDPVRLFKNDDGTYFGLREYSDASLRQYSCLSAQGTTNIMRDVIENDSKTVKLILLDRAETLLHSHFGDENYWSVRRSMRFAKHLVSIANEFRAKYLNSTDEVDKTIRPEKWENHQPVRGTPLGGPYLAVHFRRRDYLYARRDKIPSLSWAAEQLRRKLNEHNLKNLFVATDAPDDEFFELKKNLQDFNVFRFSPTKDVFKKIKDGGVAIVDQIISSYSRYFMGSTESTFSFRIQEEREILGFPTQKTFDILCPENQFNCERGSVWKIVYPVASYREEL